jgi:hypothetical protein
MQGWFKLMETLRPSGPSSNQSVRLLPNSNLNNTFVNGTLSNQRNLFEESLPPTINTGNHILNSSVAMHSTTTLDSPPNIFNSPSLISVTSTPRQTIDDIPCGESELVLESRARRESIPSVEIESTTTSSSTSTGLKKLNFILL